MTDIEFQKKVDLINKAQATGHEGLACQLSWQLWEELEAPRFTYPAQEEEENSC